jgi:hypothetical protein
MHSGHVQATDKNTNAKMMMHTKVAKMILSLASLVISSPIRLVAALESEGPLIIIHRRSHGELILSSPSRCRSRCYGMP